MNDFIIDRRSKIPYDKQLQLILRSKIALGVLRKGAPMQAVEDLAAELGIDPSQVLKAYRLLEKERRINKVNDQWVVSTANIPKTVFDEFVTIFESIKRNTKSVPSIKTLGLDPKHKVKGQIAQWLNTTTALTTKRIYYGDDVPYMLVNLYYPASRYPGLEEELAKDQPYYPWFHQHYGVKMTHSVRQMNGINLKKSDAFLLGVPEGTACYHTFVQAMDDEGHIYEVSEVFSISEIMHFTIEQEE